MMNKQRLKPENEPEDYKKIYYEFWVEIVENEDGSLNKDQIMRELSDFYYLIDTVPKVYDYATGGIVSKPMTEYSAICSCIDDHINELCEFAIEDYKESIDLEK